MRLTDPNYYTARSQTFAAGDQVPSATLNDIQDGIVDGNTAMDLLVDELEAQAEENQTASENQNDSPAPDVGGAKTVWVEKSTNGTTVVVLDDSVDWRDRYVIIQGVMTAGSRIAGGANDDDTDRNIRLDAMSEAYHWWLYTRDGTDGTTSANCVGILYTGGTEYARVFARSTDGALCMCKDAHAADPNFYLVMEVRGSPIQNHY